MEKVASTESRCNKRHKSRTTYASRPALYCCTATNIRDPPFWTHTQCPIVRQILTVLTRQCAGVFDGFYCKRWTYGVKTYSRQIVWKVGRWNFDKKNFIFLKFRWKIRLVRNFLLLMFRKLKIYRFPRTSLMRMCFCVHKYDILQSFVYISCLFGSKTYNRSGINSCGIAEFPQKFVCARTFPRWEKQYMRTK